MDKGRKQNHYIKWASVLFTAVIQFAAIPSFCQNRCIEIFAKNNDSVGNTTHSEPVYIEIPMSAEYIGEETSAKSGPRVKYFNKSELEQFRLRFRNGLIVDHNEKIISNGKFLFVQKNNGKDFFIIPIEFNLNFTDDQVLKHSSLTAGLPVNSAGIVTIYNKHISELSNNSGHYKPPIHTLVGVIASFKKIGIDTSQMKIDLNLDLEGVPLFHSKNPLNLKAQDFLNLAAQLVKPLDWKSYLVGLLHTKNEPAAEAAALEIFRIGNHLSQKDILYSQKILVRSQTLVGPTNFNLAGWPLKVLVEYRNADIRYKELISLLELRLRSKQNVLSRAGILFIEYCARDIALGRRNGLNSESLDILVFDLKAQLQDRPDLLNQIEHAKDIENSSLPEITEDEHMAG